MWVRLAAAAACSTVHVTYCVRASWWRGGRGGLKASASGGRRLGGSSTGTVDEREEYEYEWQQFLGPGCCEVCAGGPRDSNPGGGKAGGAFGEQVLDSDTFAVVVDTVQTRLQETQKVVAELAIMLDKSDRDLRKQLDSTFSELEDDLELRVDEVAKSVRDGSKEIQVLARAVKNLEQWRDEVAYRYLRPLEDRVTHLEQCWS